jgi:nanoRNase/pAp phosphatase (c-di-AMP/oligoRNAs hydrolase)
VVACISAYCQLLSLQGYDATGIVTGPWNQTIPNSIKQWPIPIKNVCEYSSSECRFILVDISDPNFMEMFVVPENIIEVYDHHYGYEQYWHEKLPNSAFIEKVGACATLIWEQFKKHGHQNEISAGNANLLYTAIFANTLNFKAHVTTDRDRAAAQELLAYTTLPADWKERYYQEVEVGFKNDLALQIKNDTKTIAGNNYSFYFSQIELWDAECIIALIKEQKIPFEDSSQWLINIISIQEGCSYLYTNSERLKNKLLEAIPINNHRDGILVASRLWLRKELIPTLNK